MESNARPFPKPIPLWKMLGPSFLVLATGLGTGEIVLWPLVASEFGMGLLWVAALGITFQYFINMEIERYTLVKGETVFVGASKIFGWAPYWLVFSTLACYAIPGTAAASAQIFGHILGIEDYRWIGILFLVVMGFILSIGKTVYGMMEALTKITTAVLIPMILFFVVQVGTEANFVDAAKGFIGDGDGYSFIPSGIAFTLLLGAFAYSGTGGNLNLSQSVYIKEEGYGMGKYSQKLRGLLNRKQRVPVRLDGPELELNEQNISNFRKWWRRISLEHFIVFWFFGLLVIALLMLLAYATVYGSGEVNHSEGIAFVISQGTAIGGELSTVLGGTFLVVIGLMLFQSQMGAFDASIRIISENVAIKYLQKTGNSYINLARIYFIFLWLQIALGVTLFLFGVYNPIFLITVAAILNAISMFVHVGIVNWTNHRLLQKPFQAPFWRKAVMLLIFTVFGAFSAFTLVSSI